MNDERSKRDRLHSFIEGQKAVADGLVELQPLVPEADTWEDIKDLLAEAILFGFEAGWLAGVAKFAADFREDAGMA